MASVAPLLPTWKMMASEVPTPDVERRERVEEAAVPPMTRGEVAEVVKVGVVPKTKAPEPVSSVMVLARTEEAAEAARFEEASVTTKREAVKPEKVIVPEEETPVAPEIVPVKVTLPVVPASVRVKRVFVPSVMVRLSVLLIAIFGVVAVQVMSPEAEMVPRVALPELSILVTELV